MSLQMLEVAIGWEVYSQHRSALDLGWIGLAEFIPMFVLALPAGHLADRVPRRLVFAGAESSRLWPGSTVSNTSRHRWPRPSRSPRRR